MVRKKEARDYDCPEPAESLRRVQTFLRAIWHHPFLDNQTLAFRHSFPAYFAHFCEVWHLDPSRTVAAPAGSARWLTDPEGGSDYDFIFYTDHANLTTWKKHYGQRFRQGMDLTPKMHPVESLDETSLMDTTMTAQFLLTPDNFMIGRLDLARKVRLAALTRPDHFIPHPYYPHHPNPLYGGFYSHFYYWPREGKGKTRVEYQAQLRARGDESLAQEFLAEFYHRIDRHPLPDIAIFRQAIVACDGKLWI